MCAGWRRHRASRRHCAIERAGNAWRIEGRVRGYREGGEIIEDVTALEL